MSDTPTINKHTFPPGGWQFRQPQTNWTNPLAMVSFIESIKAIIKHRQANPAITAKFQLATDPVAVEEELLKYTRARLKIPDPPKAGFFARSRSLSAVAVGAAAALKRAAEGAAVPIDWFRSGGQPVDRELAEHRAKTCIACPKHGAPAWYAETAGIVIQEIIEARADVKLETSQDDALKGCDVCGCIMRIKVHTPLDVILRGTKPNILAEFPPNCWITRRDQ